MQNIGEDRVAAIITQFNLLYGIFVFCIVLALKLFGGFTAQRRFTHRAIYWASTYNIKDAEFYLFLLVALCLFVLKWLAIGGFSGTVLSGELDRGTATAGIGYILGPADISLAFASLYAMMRFRKTERLGDLLLFLAIFMFAAFSFSLFGGRKALLQHIIISIAFWNIMGGSIRFGSIRFLVITALSVSYFILLLEFRLNEADRAFLSHNAQLTLFSGIAQFLSNFSYNDTYYFIIDYFQKNSPFFGRTFIDLLSAPLPSSIFPDKPPVDEGLYVKSLAEGAQFRPPTPASAFAGLGSWPPETFGNFIMNFGQYSVLAGGVVLGTLVAAGLRLVNKFKIGLLSIYFIFHAALNFQISNLRIVNALTLLLFGSLVVVLVYFVSKIFIQPRRSARFRQFR